MIHTAACDQATGDRTGQDAPVLPTRGRWSKLRHVWASKQWKNYIRSMDYRFLKKWYRIVCRFLSLWSHYHDMVTCQSLCFCSAKAAVNCVLRKFAKSLFGSAWIWQSSKPPKFPVPFFKIQNLMSDEVAAETGYVFFKFQNSTSWQSWHSSAHACTSSWLTNAVRDAPAASVKVVVSASCLRGKRPSASSKLLRYLEALPMMYFLYPPVFSKHASNLSRE